MSYRAARQLGGFLLLLIPLLLPGVCIVPGLSCAATLKHLGPSLSLGQRELQALREVKHRDNEGVGVCIYTAGAPYQMTLGGS